MDTVKLEFPVEAYQRLRELVVAGGKWQATGEGGLHSASQLLLMMDGQVVVAQRAMQQEAAKPAEKPVAPPEDSGTAAP